MKPILKYPGAKWRIADWIIDHMPPHESYVEPYFGSGAIFFNKPPCRIETINDMDGEIVNFFRVCREKPLELARAVYFTPWSREEYMRSFGCDLCNDVERARRFAIQCWMTFGAGNTKQRGWRHSTGGKKDGGPDNPKLWGRLPGVIQEVSERLLAAQIENRPALDVIAQFDGDRILLYVDPPYVRSARATRADAYNHEMTDADHGELLKALISHKGMVLLSGYNSDLYQDMLRDWLKVEKSTTAESGKRRTECLWINPWAQERRGMLGMELDA